MGDETYTEIVDGTVDDIKQRVQEDDLDLERLLEAEKEGKDRITLTDWLEERIAEQDASDDAEEHDEQQTSAVQDAGDTLLSPRVTAFGVGAIVGLVLTVLIVASGAVSVTGQQDTVAPSTAANQLNTYLSDNKDVFLPEQIRDRSSLTVDGVEPYENSGLYKATLLFSTTVRNQSRTQEVIGFMTRDANYILFGAQPFSLNQPAADQIERQRTARQ